MNKQFTPTGTAQTCVTVGWQCQWVQIQNNGLGAVRITVDGSTVPVATTLGSLLNPNKEMTVAYGGSDQGRGPIKVILETGTSTTLDIMTPDLKST